MPVTADATRCPPPPPADDAGWAAFLARQDMRWRELPDGWDSAPFIGNGRLGAMLWRNERGGLHVEVSRGDLYDHRNAEGWAAPTSVLYTTCRLPNGHFEVTWPGDAPQVELRLDLWNAELCGRLNVGGRPWQLRCFAHAQRDVIVLQWSGVGAGPQLEWRPDPACSTRTFRRPEGLDLVPYPPQARREIAGVQVSVQEMPSEARYHTEGTPPGQYATAWLRLDSSDGVTFLISVRRTCPGSTAGEEAAALVRRAADDGIGALTDEHRRWWHDYYRASMVSVPDAEVESFYWIQMYKLASASREGGPILDLMGPWFAPTNWPAIWWNLNLQLTYWPCYTANHLAEATPLIDVLWEQRDNLARNAAPHGHDAYAIGRASGPDCRADVGTEVGNLPWIMHNLWLHYRSAMDDGLLRDRVFPLMKGAFRYLWHILVRRPDGVLTLPPTASPEYVDATPACSYTLACLRWLAATLIDAARRLGQDDDPITTDCRDVLEHLEPYPVDPETGIMVGSDTPFVRSHRHWSHLFMIYPFLEYTADDPARRDLVERSLRNWTQRPEHFAGYSWLGAAAMHASAGEGDAALALLGEFLDRAPLPNTLYREGSPVIETPLAFARVLQEMLMTSHGGLIRVFPAVPDAWPDAVFDNLRAEGAFLVSARRRGGVTRLVQVTSLAGEPCRVRTTLPGAVRGSSGVAIHHDACSGVTEVRLARGQTVRLYCGDAPPGDDFRPLAHDPPARPWGGRDAVDALPAIDPPLETTR